MIDALALTSQLAVAPIWIWVTTIQGLLYQLFALVILVVAIVALVKCLSKDAQRFEIAFKRTKSFWMAMTGGACLLALLGLLGFGPFTLLFPVAAAVMATVYLADVNPEVS
ncbi:DUF2516 family protein [Nesterenkonia populi]|uniref:DUF2516 family protein n=1 Tax=Nesterenkonia populi TaxID=1591087 RepID=UPI0011BE426C|nr:DUF2516 family protein [Nesterenkonia populi]